MTPAARSSTVGSSTLPEFTAPVELPGVGAELEFVVVLFEVEVGEAEGAAVGATLGLAVGLAVGEAVGRAVGLAVGLAVGEVGLAVGAGVLQSTDISPPAGSNVRQSVALLPETEFPVWTPQLPPE